MRKILVLLLISGIISCSNSLIGVDLPSAEPNDMEPVNMEPIYIYNECPNVPELPDKIYIEIDGDFIDFDEGGRIFLNWYRKAYRNKETHLQN